MMEQRARSNGKRGTALRATLERALHSYMVAAGAAGVGLLALASPADAEVVYTRVQVELEPNQYYYLDLNNDGFRDFLLSNIQFAGIYTFQQVNALWSTGRQVNGEEARHYFPLALMRGAKIGNSQPFSMCGCSSFGLIMAGVNPGQTGYWGNVDDRYLGLKLMLKGESHFGWARMTVRVEGTKIQAYLDGYAYETNAGRPILAGQTSGTGDDPVFDQDAPEARASSPNGQRLVPREPLRTSLGLLAIGDRGIPLWRPKAVEP
jgi:hypothetical protein